MKTSIEGADRASDTACVADLARSALCRPAARLSRLQARIRNDSDADAIHDVRVATRRLRSGMALFRPFLPGGRAKRLARRAKRLTRHLGAARNLEVVTDYCEALLSAAGTTPAERRAASDLLAHVRPRRAAALAKVRTAAAHFDARGLGADVRRLVGDVAPIPDAGSGRTARNAKSAKNVNTKKAKKAKRAKAGWLGAAPDGDPLRVHAMAAISQRWSRVVARRAEALAAEDAHASHRLRIAVKKHRYTLEALAPLFGPGRIEYLARVRRWQTALGDIQDRAVLLELAGDALEGRALAAMEERLRRETDRRVAALSRDLGRLNGAEHLLEIYGLMVPAAEARNGRFRGEGFGGTSVPPGGRRTAAGLIRAVGAGGFSRDGRRRGVEGRGAQERDVGTSRGRRVGRSS